MAGLEPLERTDPYRVDVTLRDPHHARMLSTRIRAAIRELAAPRAAVIVRAGATEADATVEIRTRYTDTAETAAIATHTRIERIAATVIRAYERERER